MQEPEYEVSGDDNTANSHKHPQKKPVRSKPHIPTVARKVVNKYQSNKEDKASRNQKAAPKSGNRKDIPKSKCNGLDSEQNGRSESAREKKNNCDTLHNDADR